MLKGVSSYFGEDIPMNFKLISMVALSVSMIGVASASTFRWTWSSVGHTNGAQPTGGNLFYNPAGGGIDALQIDYNSTTKNFRYDVTFDNTQTNGFWAAVSPGDNPKGHAGELALFYFDASAGSPVLSAYAYNGVNGGNSYKDGSPAPGTQTPDFIRSSLTNSSWINNLSVSDSGGKRRMIFDIDATSINNHTPAYPGPGGIAEWTGAAFGNKIGIWFHPAKGVTSSYSNGKLTNFHVGQEGWLDGDNLQTVPEPATMTALGLGLAAIARRRRAKK